MRARRKDPTIRGLEDELRGSLRDNRMYGRSDYRRGYQDGLRRAIELHKGQLSVERQCDDSAGRKIEDLRWELKSTNIILGTIRDELIRQRQDLTKGNRR